MGTFISLYIVGSCYYSLAAKAMIEICTILGKTERAEYYQELAEKIDRALVKAYVYEDGRVGVHASVKQDAEYAPVAQLYRAVAS